MIQLLDSIYTANNSRHLIFDITVCTLPSVIMNSEAPLYNFTEVQRELQQRWKEIYIFQL